MMQTDAKTRAQGGASVARVIGLVLGAVLSVGAVGCVRGSGVQDDVDPSPSVVSSELSRNKSEPPDNSSGLPDNMVRVSLGESGCSLRSGEIVLGRLTFVAVNSSSRLAAFDIGVVQEGHTIDELRSHVEGLRTGPVARSLDDVAAQRPGYFLGSLAGRSPGGGRPLVERPESLMSVAPDYPASWFPLGDVTPPGSTFAVICYLLTPSSVAFVPAGVAGPVTSASPARPRTNPGHQHHHGVLLASIGIDDSGCHATRRHKGVVLADYVRFLFSTAASTHVSFDIGVLADGTTFEQLKRYIASLPRHDDPRWPGERQPGFVRIRENWGEIGFYHGGIGPHIGNPVDLKTGWTAEWTGPGGQRAPVGAETFVVICYRNLRTGPGMTPIDLMGPFEVR